MVYPLFRFIVSTLPNVRLCVFSFSRLLVLSFIVLMMHSLFSQLILQQRCPCPYAFNFNTLHYSHGMCIVCISVGSGFLSATHVTIINTITFDVILNWTQILNSFAALSKHNAPVQVQVQV